MTVRGMKDFVLRAAGVRSHFDFIRLSAGHRALWDRLNRLGMRGMPPGGEDVPPDVDAAAPLTDGEAEAIMAEFRALPGRRA